MNNENYIEKPVKKRMNMFAYSIIMLIVFLLVFITIHMFLGKFLSNNIMNYPFGKDLIGEAILAVLVFIVMLLWKNSYVFTQKHESLGKSLKYGAYYLILGGFFLIFIGIFSGGLSNWHGVINLLIFCFLIGMYEEFLCRGWLLNEFLERYGDSSKGVWLSIIASGVIFGLLHTINIYTGGMSISGAIVQVLSAAASGIVFGVIYYKTKNIWSVVLLHAFWDFSLLLSTNSVVKSFTPSVELNTILSLVFGILLAIVELCVIIPYIKIKSKPKKGFQILWSIVPAILYVIVFFGYALSSLIFVHINKPYEFDNIKIKEYSISSNNFSKYNINYNNYDNTYKYSLYKNKNKLIFKNDITDSFISIKTKSLVDYSIIETDYSYIIGYLDLDKNYDLYLYYNIISKDILSNDEMFLDSIKSNFKKYGIINGEIGTIEYLYDNTNDKDYLAVNINNTYYLLKEDDKMGILNRDK